MSSVETMSVQEMRERYLASLTPIERMDYELACAREKRMVAEREDEGRRFGALLDRLARSRTSRRGASLTPDEVRLLLDGMYLLKGSAPVLSYQPEPKGAAERAHRRLKSGAA